ncbi:MAG: hypothetical protein SGILL_005968, partial [Bacillariaceae sp.]
MMPARIQSYHKATLLVLIGYAVAIAAFQQSVPQGKRVSRHRQHDIPTRIRVFSAAAEDDALVEDPEVTRLKTQLMLLADQTQRGFEASAQERSAVKDIIYELASYNPSQNPARAYYDESTSTIGSDDYNDDESMVGGTISGKWNLIYTD